MTTAEAPSDKRPAKASVSRRSRSDKSPDGEHRRSASLVALATQSSSQPMKASEDISCESSRPAKGPGDEHKQTPSSSRQTSDAEEDDPLKRTAKAKREARKKEKEAEARKVMIALWPTSELLSEFKRIAGVEPDPQMLLRDVRFNDMWVTFDRNPKPSTKERTALRKHAQEVASKKAAKRAEKRTQPEGEQKVSNVENVNTRASSKRKDISLLSSTLTGQGTAEKQSKDPKKARTSTPRSAESGHQVAQTAMAASTSSPSPLASAEQQSVQTYRDVAAPPAANDAEMADVIESEEDEPTLDTFTKDMRTSLDTDVREGAEKEKSAAPWLLYIHKTCEERATMPKGAWQLFLEKFSSACIDLQLGAKPAPKITWTGFSKGVGVLAPIDELNRDLAIEIVSKIEIGGEKVKAWKKGEKGDWCVLALQVPPALDKVPAGKLLQAAFRGNQVNAEGQYRVLAKLGQKGSHVIRLLAKVELVEELKRHDGVLWVGPTAVRLHHKKEPLRSTTEV